MANAITPIAPATFDGELIFNMSNYTVSDSFCYYIESMSITYRPLVLSKRTGFEKIKFVVNDTTGTDIFIDINIMLVGNLPRWLRQQLQQLAKGVNSAGMELHLRDNWCSNMTYSCKWVNAMDAVDNSTILNGGSMQFEAWDRTAL